MEEIRKMVENIFLLFALFFINILSQLDAREKVISFRIDYKESSCELCRIGARYDSDKSSQRENVSESRHCHPYTLFYNSLFQSVRDEHLVIGELGILYGASLLMWRDFFLNALIFGFEYDSNFIDSFKTTYGNDRIELFRLNVHNRWSILKAFQATGVQYDLIIDDTTHEFEDQLRIIENVHSYLKPGECS